MCGIFGFITKNGNGPDLGLLRRIAAVTETRGAHAFGLAWTAGGAIGMHKRPGRATSYLRDLEYVAGCEAMVGHCRYATHGSPDDNSNNHPHASGTGWIVHNGVVRNYQRLIAQYGLETETQCDSEVLALLIAKHAGKLIRRAGLTAGSAEGNLAILGLWRNPTRLLIVRNGNPLHFGESKDGWYFASLAQGLPGEVFQVRAGYVGQMTYKDGWTSAVNGRVAEAA